MSQAKISVQLDPGVCTSCSAVSHFAPIGPRRNEGHVAARFDDGLKYRVFLNGDDVTTCMTEAQAGSNGDGWVYGYVDDGVKFLACPLCNDHLITQYRFGDVRVEAIRESVPE